MGTFPASVISSKSAEGEVKVDGWVNKMSDFDEENLCTPSVSDQQSFSVAYYHHGFTMIVLPSLTSSYNSSCDKKGPLTLPR